MTLYLRRLNKIFYPILSILRMKDFGLLSFTDLQILANLCNVLLNFPVLQSILLGSKERPH